MTRVLGRLITLIPAITLTLAEDLAGESDLDRAEENLAEFKAQKN